jgi:hypothetical protein
MTPARRSAPGPRLSRWSAIATTITRFRSLTLITRFSLSSIALQSSVGQRVRGYVHDVVIGCGVGVTARHRRSYEKAGALDQAAPLQGWDLPGEFATLHRLLEARMGKKGKREYVQVLRLLETFEMAHVHGAVKQSLELGAIGYDAVKHLVLCRIERRPPRLDLDFYPYLPKARVETTDPASYTSLMTQVPA